MEIKPKSRDEIEKDADERKREMNRKSLLKPGIYDGEVMRAEETTSKSSGNPMIKLKVRIFHDGGEAHLYDYITSTQVEKLCAFCDAVGLSKEYDAGDVKSDDMEGRPFRAKIGIEDEKPKDDGEGNWPAKNKIKDYLPRNEKDGGRKVEKPEPTPAEAAAENEDLPF
jgi:hypothetical protein